MNILVTGGAGFIGRWVVKTLLDRKHRVTVIDDLSNGSPGNLDDLKQSENFIEFINATITDMDKIKNIFNRGGFEICIHCAAQINVQESLDNPERSFNVNMIGTYNVLEACRKHDTKLVLIGTCMVYDIADISGPIDEEHSVNPTSPYSGTKLGAENLAYSYHKGLGLPVVILRPFNTYGPFQKSNMEGGVISIFIQRMLDGEVLNIFGDGKQTRDLLYVEDCARFIVEAAFSDMAVGETINAGTGREISVNELAKLIVKDESRMQHVEHHHPQSEIERLTCDYSKAERLLGWRPETTLEEGIERTKEWIQKQGKA